MQPGQDFWCRVHLAPDDIIDGDTLRARLLVPALPGGLSARLRPQPDGEVRLRLLGLDAPESGFAAAPAGLQHQPLRFAVAASEALQQALALPAAGLALWINAQGVDRYGRLLVLLYRQPRAQAPTSLLASVNATLLACGAAYPDLHAGLSGEVLQELQRATRHARQAGLGVWPADRTGLGFLLQPLASISADQLIWPRLYRRVMECASQSARPLPDGQRALAAGDLREYLLQRGGRCLHLRSGVQKNLGEWLEMTGHQCRFPGDVENFLQVAQPQGGKLP